MSRYTLKLLKEDLKAVNAKLAGSGYYLVAQSRNGYTVVDEFKGDISEGHSGICVNNLQCGSPRDCIEAAYNYEPRENTKSLNGTQKSLFGPM